jgi:chromosome segregation ATPase
MNTRRRIIGIVLAVLSVLLLLFSVTGIVGTWWLNSRLANGVVQVLTTVEDVLANADDSLNQLETRVTDARGQITSFQESVAAATQGLAENPVVLTAVSERLDVQLEPAVTRVRETVQSLRETVVAIENAIDAINAIPFVSIDQKLTVRSRLQTLTDGLDELTEGVAALRDTVRQARAEAAAQLEATVGELTGKLDNGLTTINGTIVEYRSQVDTLRTNAATLRANLTRWLDVISVVLTIILLWLIFSQVVVFMLGLSIYRQKNLFARWTGDGAVAVNVAAVPA